MKNKIHSNRRFFIVLIVQCLLICQYELLLCDSLPHSKYGHHLSNHQSRGGIMYPSFNSISTFSTVKWLFGKGGGGSMQELGGIGPQGEYYFIPTKQVCLVYYLTFILFLNCKIKLYIFLNAYRIDL